MEVNYYLNFEKSCIGIIHKRYYFLVVAPIIITNSHLEWVLFDGLKYKKDTHLVLFDYFFKFRFFIRVSFVIFTFLYSNI